MRARRKRRPGMTSLSKERHWCHNTNDARRQGPTGAERPMNTSRYRNAEAPDPQARQAACDLAVEALCYIAGDPELLARFLAITGLDPGAIRAAAGDPDFLLGVLEYVCDEERLLVAFATHAGIGPEEIETAKQALAGADWERDVP